MITKTDLKDLVKYAEKCFQHDLKLAKAEGTIEDMDLLLMGKNTDGTINGLCIKHIQQGIYIGLTVRGFRLYEGVLTTPQEIAIFKDILSNLNSQPQPITS